MNVWLIIALLLLAFFRHIDDKIADHFHIYGFYNRLLFCPCSLIFALLAAFLFQC